MNPFYFRKIPVDAPFCDRVKELAELKSHAKNRANVVLISPRRFGKTSLVQRAQAELGKEGLFTVYIDLYGVTSIDDVASRIASNLYTAVHTNKSLFKKAMGYFSSIRPKMTMDITNPKNLTFGVDVARGKSGKELLEETLTGFGHFIQDNKTICNIAIDEFQEITELSDSKFIEGTMRAHIQNHSNASYFFVGSRRSILADMFNNRNRAFYQSAINMRLGFFPEEDLVNFLVARFKEGGKDCSKDVALSISNVVHRHPYYSQKLAYHIYELSSGSISIEDVNIGSSALLNDEKDLYEMMVQGLGSRQIALLVAIAKEPSNKPYSVDYISSHGLGSIGTVQGGFRKLISLDYIENIEGTWKVVDPVFTEWLKRQ